MKKQSFANLPWACLLHSAVVGLLLSACTVEHMEVGVDQVGVNGQNSSGAEDPTSNASTSSPSNTGTVGSCPDDCVTDLACRLCDDGETCATPVFECNADGSCGDVTWECEGGNGPSQPDAGGSDSTKPDCDCAVPAICHLCDDDTCAEANVECNPDGSCGDIEWKCPGGGVEPGDAGNCPDPEVLCKAQCSGNVLDVAPDCPVSDCDCDAEPTPACECAVIDICKPCDEDTCATPIVDCNPDGSCGETLWVCQEPSEPVCGCAVDADCRLCEDGTCAAATATCNPDGTCGETVYTCPAEEKYDCDISGVLCDLAITCEGDEVPTRNGDCYGPCVDPKQCLPVETYDCDISQVTCKAAIPDCGPDMVPTQVGECFGECVAPSSCAPAEGETCPETCAVIDICQLCEDDSCAIANVSCNADGSCGEVDWVCPND